jgi:hypothetical protein
MPFAAVTCDIKRITESCPKARGVSDLNTHPVALNYFERLEGVAKVAARGHKEPDLTDLGFG